MKIKLPSFLRLSNIINSKKLTVVFSVLLAFALWVGISITENPTREKSFTGVSATISIDGTAAAEMGLGIVSNINQQKFTVTVTGPNYVVSSLKPEDFMLSVSVDTVNKAGTHTLDVVGVSNSSKTGYTFASISPAQIDVTFDYFDTKSFELQPQTVGVIADEGLVAEAPVLFDPMQSSISVRGPRNTLEKVASVVALAEVNSTLSESNNYFADIVLYDSNNDVICKFLNKDGKVVDANNAEISNPMISLSFTNVSVTQPISKKKTLGTKVTFKNLPDGLTEEDISYKITPKTVTVIGTPDVIDGMDNVTLAAIDFRNVTTTSNVFEVSPTLPDGVKLLDSVEFFTVELDVSAYREITLDIANIKCTGLSSDTAAKTDSIIRNVRICVPRSVANRIKSSDFYAVVDLKEKSVGDYTVEAIIKSDSYTDAWQIGTYSTSVSLSKK